MKIVISAAIILVLAIGALLRLNNLDNIGVNLRTSDERAYAYQAKKIAEFGKEGVKRRIVYLGMSLAVAWRYSVLSVRHMWWKA